MINTLFAHLPVCVYARAWQPLLLGALLALCASASQASVRVETLQMPAWLERDGDMQPLAPGVTLRDGDGLRTGSGARIVLRLDEGSRVKLGEDARFAIGRVSVEDDQWGLFRGLFEVLSGAFRFTTGALGAARRRDVSIRVGVTTAGIRGTDIWGRATPRQDLVCLIEGDIEVSRAGEQLRMDTPLTVFVAPRDGEPQPIRSVDPAQLAEWAAETEPQAGDGVLRQDGRWSLQLASYRAADRAQRLLARLREAGYAAAVTAAEVDGATWQRVAIAGFVGAADARAAGERLSERFALPPGWVSARP